MYFVLLGKKYKISVVLFGKEEKLNNFDINKIKYIHKFGYLK